MGRPEDDEATCVRSPPAERVWGDGEINIKISLEVFNMMSLILNSGLHLGWLINPQDKQAEIYCLNQAVEIVKFPHDLSGEEVLPGFVLKLPL